MNSDARNGQAALLRILLGTSEIAIALDHISEIVRMVDLGHALAHSGGLIRGAINLRGEIVPVLDVAPLLQEQPVAADPAHYIVIVRAGAARYGLMANDTLPVVDVAASGRRSFDGRGGKSFIREVANIDGRLVPVLDSEAVFAANS